MNYWVLKTEPSTYSYERLIKDKKVIWDGIRNYQARNFLRNFNIGDLAVIYHSGDLKAAVGIAKVTKGPFTEIDDWVAVEIAPERPLKNPVPLAKLKSDKILKSILLVRHSRISVSPLTQTEFEQLIELSK